MTIRFATCADISGILQLLYQVGDVHHDIRPDIFRSNAQKYDEIALAELLRDPQRPIFIAEEGKVLGYCFCQMKTYYRDSVICDHTTCYIDDLCVHEDCRGKRVGTSLYQAVCRYAKSRGCYNITLNVWSCNPSAMAFYEKLGLKPQKVGMEQLL